MRVGGVQEACTTLQSQCQKVDRGVHDITIKLDSQLISEPRLHAQRWSNGDRGHARLLCCIFVSFSQALFLIQENSNTLFIGKQVGVQDR